MALVDSIIGAESGGNPNAQNPNSSAGGLGQFIDSTWLAMLKQERPDLVEGRSPQELLALKSDPALSRQMTEAYAAQNGKILTGAGFEANPGNTYLAHFAGPQGAVKVLSADPATPVAAVLGEAAVKANPFLRGMTAADLQAWAGRKMGAGGQAAATPAPSVPPTSAPATMAIPPTSYPSAAPPLPSAAPAAQPEAQRPSLMGQMPADQVSQPPPIFFAPRKPMNLSKLQAAMQASGNRGPIFKG